MSIDEAVYFHSIQVRSLDIDNQGRGTPKVLAAFLLEAALAHASTKNYALYRQAGHQAVWFLTGLRVRYLSPRPLLNDPLTIETWVPHSGEVVCRRDFWMRSLGEEPAAAGSSSWVMVEADTGRPLPLEDWKESFPHREGYYALPAMSRKLPPLPQKSFQGRPFRAPSSAIDLNNHVSALNYPSWVFDAYAPGWYENWTILEMDIRFLAEGNYGDKLSVRSSFAPQALPEDLPVSSLPRKCRLHSVQRHGDGRELCRIRLVWEQKA